MLGCQEWARLFRHRFGGFALLSGLGWIIDFITYSTVAQLPVSLFTANLAGAAAGMGTVFIGGRLSVFRHSRNRLHIATGLYVIWSSIAILFASVLINVVGVILHNPMIRPILDAMLVATGLRIPIKLAISTIAKVVVTPLTMALNFCAMNLINGHRPTPQPASNAPEDQDSGFHSDVQLRETDRTGRPSM